MNWIKPFLSLLLLSIFYPLASINAQDTDTTLLFDYSLDELMKIKIESGAKREESIEDIPSSIVVVTRQDIEIQGWQTLEQVLNNVTGMYMINDYLWFGSDNFGVRGFFSTGAFNSMTVLINGMSQKEDWYNSFPLTKCNVPVEAIERIEVIRGPMSVVYGSNAFLGAINIVTSSSVKRTKVSYGMGTNGNYTIFGRTSGEENGIKYTFNVSGYGSNGISEPYSKMTNNINDEWGLPNNPTSKGQLTDHRKFIEGSFSYSGFYFNFIQTQTSRGVIDYYPGFDDGHLAEIQSSNSIVGYKNHFGKFEIDGKIGYYSFRNRLDYMHNSDTTAYGFNDIYSDAIDAEVNTNYNINSSWLVQLGMYYRRVLRDKLVVDAPNISDDYNNLSAGLSRENRINTWATFLQTRYSFAKKIDITAGMRIEQTPSYTSSYNVRFDPSNTNDYLAREGTYKYGSPYIIPRAAVIYHISNNHHLKLMFGTAIKQASIGENMDIVRYPDRDHLKPSYMQTTELNYYGLLSQKAIVNLSLFYNYANNLISRTNQLEEGIMRLFNTNSGKLQTLGLEASAQLKLTTRLNTNVSFVVQNSKNLQTGYEDIALEYSPNFLSYASLSYFITKDITLGLSGHLVGSMETYWRPDTRNALDPNDNRTPEELIADGSRIGQKSPQYLNLNVNVRFNNLFDKRIFLAIHSGNILNSEIRFPTTRSNDIFEKGTLGYSRYISFSIGAIFEKGKVY